MFGHLGTSRQCPCGRPRVWPCCTSKVAPARMAGTNEDARRRAASRRRCGLKAPRQEGAYPRSSPRRRRLRRRRRRLRQEDRREEGGAGEEDRREEGDSGEEDRREEGDSGEEDRREEGDSGEEDRREEGDSGKKTAAKKATPAENRREEGDSGQNDGREEDLSGQEDRGHPARGEEDGVAQEIGTEEAPYDRSEEDCDEPHCGGAWIARREAGRDTVVGRGVAEVRDGLVADRTRLLDEIGIAERGLADLLSGGVDGAGNDQADVGSTSLERDAEMSLVARPPRSSPAGREGSGPHRVRDVRQLRELRPADRQDAVAWRFPVPRCA